MDLFYEAFKAAVYKYGPMTIGIESDHLSDDNDKYTHYFMYKDKKDADHVVLIEGWDDNIDVSKFKPNTPPGKGAFLVKNSWGPGRPGHPFNLDGYVWVSYYEGSFDTLYHFDATDNTYNQIFQHDALGATGSGTSFDSKKDSMANIFKVPAGSSPVQLSAATVYSLVPGTTYTVSVYKNPTTGDPESGRQLDINKSAATSVTEKLSTAGYHTIDFSKSIALSAGDTFSIVVQVNKLDKDDDAVSYEVKNDPKDAGGKSIIAAGESYFVDEDDDWTDFTEYTKEMATLKDKDDRETAGNINIKGIARKTSLTGLSKATSGTVLWVKGEKKPLQHTLLKAQFSTGFSDTIAIGDGGVEVKGVNTNKLGTYNATVTYGGKSVKFTVKVVDVTNISTPLSTIYIAKGKSHTLPVVAYAGNTAADHPKLTYKSSKPSVLKVSSAGKLTASKNVKKKTKVTITIKAKSGYKKNITVYVVPKTSKLKKIAVSGVAASMKKGTYKYAAVKLNPAGATGVDISYTTSNSKVLTVDKAGKIFAKAKGTAKVKVKAGSKTWTKKITVR